MNITERVKNLICSKVSLFSVFLGRKLFCTLDRSFCESNKVDKRKRQLTVDIRVVLLCTVCFLVYTHTKRRDLPAFLFSLVPKLCRMILSVSMNVASNCLQLTVISVNVDLSLFILSLVCSFTKQRRLFFQPIHRMYMIVEH